jgi:hypothetical protein
MNFGELPDDLPPEIKERAERFHKKVLDPLIRRGLSKFFKKQGTDLGAMREMIEKEDLTGTVSFFERDFTGTEMLKIRDEVYGLMIGTVINFSMLQTANMISAVLRGEQIDSIDVETGAMTSSKIEPLSKETLEKMGVPEDIINGMNEAMQGMEEGEDWKQDKKEDPTPEPPPEGKRNRWKPDN